MNKTIKKVGEDLDQIKFNTAVASLMEWLNHLGRKEQVSPEEYRTLLLLLAPFAPHFTEELWQALNNAELETQNQAESGVVQRNSAFVSIHTQLWPQYDETLLVGDKVTIIVQVNGKVRDTIIDQKSKIKDQKDVEALAKKSSKIQKHLEGKTVHKVIYVPGRAINFVVN